MSKALPKYYPKQAGKDHVVVNIIMTVIIGVEELEDDTPSEFCDQVRALIKETGAIPLTTSISSQKRMPYKGSPREQIIQDAKENKDHPLHIVGE